MGIDYFNLVEGMFWIGLGVWLVNTSKIKHQNTKLRGRLCRGYSDTPSPATRVLPLCRGRALVLGIGLVMFGISDFVEMASGAWWEPWWLLVWKGICVGVFILFFIHLYFERRRRWGRK